MPQTFGVIFDMDGVLVDSYRPHFESWRALAAENALELTEEQFARLFGRPGRTIITELWAGSVREDQVRSLDERKEYLYREIIRDHIPVCEGLIGLLEDLRTGGAKLAVGSSGPPENVDLVLDGLGIRTYFSAMVTGMDVTRGKPDPEVFLLAAERIAVPPARCAVIEDAPAGLQAAHRAGMKAIALTTSHPADRLSEADLVVAGLSDLNARGVRDLIFPV